MRSQTFPGSTLSLFFCINTILWQRRPSPVVMTRSVHAYPSIHKEGLWADGPGESRRAALDPLGALLIGSGHELGKAMIWKS